MTFAALLPSVRPSRLVAFLLPSLACTAPAWAQQPAPRTGAAPTEVRLAPEDADRGLNGVQKNFWFRTSDDGQYQNAGTFGQHLRPYLTDAQAIASLDRYRRQRWLHIGERAVFVASLGVYAQQVFSADKPQYFNNTQKAMLGTAVVSLIANSFITRHTNQHFIRAVEAQNGSLPSARRTGWQQLRPTTLGLTALAGRPQLALGWTLH